ncbi:Fic family protein [Treponema sp.]|uniref:Fic family protein n=1 Tax=Treponema sp. TaxID=166 RepID=UPI00260075C8|nr:Fic family protein [Treponema sp.]MCR5218424.1 Fic family protein [Treponema sp.]
MDDFSFEDFAQYLIQGEPDKKKKAYAWQTAIGLQAVDNLKPSAYLIETAKKNIEGKISIKEVQNLIKSYYESKSSRDEDDDEKEEADIVSSHITELLNEDSFSFTPLEFLNIHKRLFTGVFKFAGKIRDVNITKKEWVLQGDTVYYSGYDLIRKTMEYDFEQEKNFNYIGLSQEEIIKHFSRFTANLWQIHPFREGNTRTTAVFIIKYLRSLGYEVTNDIFAKHSWYFRNALVRANYTNIQKQIYMDTSFLENFFRNLLLNENHELKNRYLVINSEELLKKYEQKVAINAKMIGDKVAIKQKSSDIILNYLKNNDSINSSIAQQITGLSPAGVRKIFAKLTEEKIILPSGANKNRIYKLNK